MELSAADAALLRREVTATEQALAAARTSVDPLQTLADLTTAIETLTATQHELVNVLLDHGASWSTIGDALSTSNAAARRRYPRRGGRSDRQSQSDEPPTGENDIGSAEAEPVE